MKNKKSSFRDKQIRDAKRETEIYVNKIVSWISHMMLFDYTVLGVQKNNELALWLGKYFAVNGVLPERVSKKIHYKLVKCGHDSYLEITPSKFPDHVTSPPALAYLLNQEDFPKAKAKAIKFDHGDTLETFKKQADGLFAIVIKQLVAPRFTEKIPKNKSNSLYHESDACCCC